MWFDKREMILNLRGYKCERCGSTKKIQVHHKTYINVGNEGLKDVEVLCSKCHKGEHKK